MQEQNGETFLSEPKLPAGYEALLLLGQGGSARVYKCRQMSTDRFVSVKILNEESHEQERFKQEARLLSSLDHQNIQRVLAFGAEPCLHIVFEYLEGQSLADLMKSAPLSASNYRYIFPPLLSALAYVHEKGLVHRDLKPENIILVSEESMNNNNTQMRQELIPKLIDFGLARVDSSESAGAQKLTSTGALLGSPLYMSPEQCLGKRAGPASDVYSMACVLYECLSGRPPFKGSTDWETMQLRLAESAAKLEEINGIPKNLQKLIACALEKDPDKRPSAADMASKLERALSNSDFAPARRTSAGTKTLWIAGLLALLLPAIFSATYLIPQRGAKDLNDYNKESRNYNQELAEIKTELDSPKNASELDALQRKIESIISQLTSKAKMSRKERGQMFVAKMLSANCYGCKYKLEKEPSQKVALVQKSCNELNQCIKIASEKNGTACLEAAESYYKLGQNYGILSDHARENGDKKECISYFSLAVQNYEKAKTLLPLYADLSYSGPRLGINKTAFDFGPNPDAGKDANGIDFSIAQLELKQNIPGAWEKMERIANKRLETRNNRYDYYTVDIFSALAAGRKEQQLQILDNLASKLDEQAKETKTYPPTQHNFVITLQSYKRLADEYISIHKIQSAERVIDKALSMYPKELDEKSKADALRFIAERLQKLEECGQKEACQKLKSKYKWLPAAAAAPPLKEQSKP